MPNKHGIMTKRKLPTSWTEELITSVGDGLSMLVPRIEQEAFVKRCIDAASDREPTSGVRDTRRQDIIRALRRMAEKNRLPFEVVGDYFVF